MRCGAPRAKRVDASPSPPPVAAVVPIFSRAQKGYELREGAEAFLQEHPDVRALMLEAGAKLREYFGAETEFAVEVFRDPEIPMARAELYLLVKVQTGDSARETMNRFDDDWWLDNMGRADYLLHVSMEFV